VIAVTLQAALLVRHAPAAVADAFCASRLGSGSLPGGPGMPYGTRLGGPGVPYGALPGGVATGVILDRATTASR
jgi:putative acyl-CoA dehydrogenase